MLGRDYSIVERLPAAIRYDPVSVKFLYCHLLWLLMLAMSHPRKLVSVLYKIRKFAHDRQGTFQKLKSTLRGSWPTMFAVAVVFIIFSGDRLQIPRSMIF